MITNGEIEKNTLVASACKKYQKDGGTLRDKFAMAAISNPGFLDMVCNRNLGYNAGLVAEYAYELADAMVKARKKE